MKEPSSPAVSGGIARTDATGTAEMVPELLAWTTSLSHDRHLVREDLLGSAAHVTMLRKVGLLDADDAQKLRGALFAMFDEATKGTLVIPDGEEDVHMAIEARLTTDLGQTGKRLHTARSRNDQVALALRLHVRDQAARTLAETTSLALELAERARREKDVIIPAYTHRQRAQPVSAAFVISAWANALLRAADALAVAIDRANQSPLGCGACSGTSLPIERDVVAKVLHFPALTANALDTIGDRDFAIDWTYAGARVLLSLSRLATDVVDFTTSEFGYLKIGDAIAAGSSMMPQKKNPDVFELVRAKSARGVGNLSAMLTLVKGLPTGYNRDFQDDRQAVLDTGPLVRGAVRAVRAAMVHLAFDPTTCLAAVSDGSTQATDVAEALVRKGVPFREAYKATGQVVHLARERKIDLAKVSLDDAKAIHPSFDASVLAVLDPRVAVAAKKSAGGTAPERVSEQIDAIESAAKTLAARAASIPALEDLKRSIEAFSIA
ncbi:Argininosuccinate lyase [Labilithrix luteola]|uniref:Argininosuccinate lyase n=1 Tax=Labilithrix luteola TaxID=1391654 RepID=A0A0K1PS58_9BACT|nr:argininosuccinate lyase [Labilithrix luteola]AKU96370.1 Argininosuccinate lyase [Labilithrix luteola]